MLCKVFPKKSKGHNCFVTDDSIDQSRVQRECFFVCCRIMHLGLNCLHAWFTIDTFTKPFAKIVVGVTWMNLDSKLGVKMHIITKQIQTWNYSVRKLEKVA